MRILVCSLFFGMILASRVLARNAQFGDPAIVAPRPGDVLQSVVPITPTATPFPTPTALPRNPATLAPIDVSASILYGGLVAISTFVIVGIVLWLRRK